MRLTIVVLIIVSVGLFSFTSGHPFASQNMAYIIKAVQSDSLPPDTLTTEEMNQIDVGRVESVEADIDHNVVHIKLKNGKNYVVVITKELDNSADSLRKARILASQQKVPADTTSRQTNVQFESTFPGGIQGWVKYLTKTLSYPQAAIQYGIQGQVVVKFIVGVDGSVRDIQAVNGPMELRAEAIRVIAKSGKWIPAMNYGIKVESLKSQPINFRLEGY